MVKSIQSAPWIAKYALSQKGSRSQQERSGIAGNFRNVYNMDETGLFFRLFPRYSLLMPNEDISTTKGKKKAKDRIFLIVCANASGTHKIPCALIRKPKELACIKDRQWPIPYFNQVKAWMDVETYWKWFNEVFYLEGKN
jgi:hypothetical protein